jgi:hypothetical protein
VLDGELYAIAALTMHNGRITTMDILLDPPRLARLDLTGLFGEQAVCRVCPWLALRSYY